MFRFSWAKNRPIQNNVTKIKKLVYYEMILQYNIKKIISHPFEFQRLGFRSTDNLLEAVKHAAYITNLLNKAIFIPKGVVRENLVKVIAVYRSGAFKDWSNDTFNKVDNVNQFIKEAVNLAKSRKIADVERIGRKGRITVVPISYLKVRG
jgi:hypothetical protein